MGKAQSREEGSMDMFEPKINSLGRRRQSVAKRLRRLSFTKSTSKAAESIGFPGAVDGAVSGGEGDPEGVPRPRRASIAVMKGRDKDDQLHSPPPQRTRHHSLPNTSSGTIITSIASAKAGSSGHGSYIGSGALGEGENTGSTSTVAGCDDNNRDCLNQSGNGYRSRRASGGGGGLGTLPEAKHETSAESSGASISQQSTGNVVVVVTAATPPLDSPSPATVPDPPQTPETHPTEFPPEIAKLVSTPFVDFTPPATFTTSATAASGDQNKIDELTTLVAFGVLLPSLTSSQNAGMPLPLPPSPAYTQKWPDASSPSNPIPRASAPTFRRPRSGSFSGRERAHLQLPRRRSINEHDRPDLSSITMPRTSSFSGRSNSKTDVASLTLQRNASAEMSRSDFAQPEQSPNIPHLAASLLATPRRASLPSASVPSQIATASSSSTSSTSSASSLSTQISRELPLFELHLKRSMTPAIFLKGEFIIQKHTIGKEMYFLSKGRVEVVSADGGRRYGVIEQGSFFGELGVLFDIPRTASIRALQNCYCMVLTRAGLDAAVQPFPSIAERFRSVVEARLKEVERKRGKNAGKGGKRLDFVPGVGRVVEREEEESES
ncbi:hypothetical protein HK104_005580 [Borealophlyctis nickersoniae]|nr:hypothetical protein HK104_005580 [Borealophlyctis nickersoniae]